MGCSCRGRFQAGAPRRDRSTASLISHARTKSPARMCHIHRSPAGCSASLTSYSGSRSSRRIATWFTALLQQLGNEAAPSRLMTRSDTAAIVPVEVLVERDVRVPVRIALELLDAPEHGAPAVLVRQENTREPPGEIGGHFREREPMARSGRTLHRERVTEV